MAPREQARSQNKFVGEFGENAVVDFIRAQGTTVVDRNWRIKEGEIDIVGKLADATIVFIEVKTRTSMTFGHPLEAINSKKAHRLQRLALAWLATHQALGATYRIDCVAVIISANGKFAIEYRENVL
jgi:putative endonuclease